MAHECPECGQWCHCGGDIDDCGFNFADDQDACTHCPPDKDADEMDEEGCIFPGECCMHGPHVKGECHTPDMIEDTANAPREAGAVAPSLHADVVPGGNNP